MWFEREYFIELKKIALYYLYCNYDYCFLDAMHERNKTIGTNTIIVGSSHAMNGVIESEFDSLPINFSISSQDIFYDYLNVRRALDNAREKIDTCIINLGYYMMYQDVSLSDKVGEYLIPRVYKPLFNNVHNYIKPTDYDMFGSVKYDSELFSEELVKIFSREWVQKLMVEVGSFYGFFRTREDNSRLKLSGIDWKNLSYEEKERIAIERTNDHNRIKKHINSWKENESILKEMTEMLHEKKVRIIFAIFPFTKWYNKYINPDFGSEIFECLDNLDVEVEYINMNDYDIWNDDDFVDTDHLNDIGAKKASSVLNKYIKYGYLG